MIWATRLPLQSITVTGTDDTWPDIGNVTVAWLTGVTVPVTPSESTTRAGPANAVR